MPISPFGSSRRYKFYNWPITTSSHPSMTRRDPCDAVWASKPHGLPIKFHNLSIRSHASHYVGHSLVHSLDRQLWPQSSKQAHPSSHSYIVKNASGLLHAGEMMLVISPPKSDMGSCFIRALASDASAPTSSDSHIQYGPISSRLVSHHPLWRSEVVYVSTQELILPNVPLRDELLSCAAGKRPRSLPEGFSAHDWDENQVLTVAEMTGLQSCLDTPGNFLSGGQARRATICEGLLTRASVLCLDGATDGLDSATALRVVQSLKKWAQDGKRSVVLNLCHSTDEMFHLCDKVCTIGADGSQTFFGPPSDAITYFRDVGRSQHGHFVRQSLHESQAEFITRLCSFTSNLSSKWVSSSQYSALIESMSAFDKAYTYDKWETPLKIGLKTERSPKAFAAYTTSFTDQVLLLTRLQMKITFAEIQWTFSQSTLSVIISIIVGLVFRFGIRNAVSVGATQDQLNAVTAALFLSTVFNSYLSLSELGKSLASRHLIKSHQAWGVLSPSAVSIARVIGDVPLLGAQVFAFGTLTYFIIGLRPTLSFYLIFISCILSTTLALTSLFRFLAVLSPNFDVAIRYASLLLNVLVLNSGFFVRVPAMSSLSLFIHRYLDPLTNTFGSITYAQFYNLVLPCSRADLVPHAVGDGDPRFFTCLTAGAGVPGELLVNGTRYVSSFFHVDQLHLASNLAWVLLIAVVFIIAGSVASSRSSDISKSTSRVFLHAQAPQDVENVDTEIDGDASVSKDQIAQLVGHCAGSTLAWRNISYSINGKPILQSINGIAVPGELTALIGVSGAGKTTLLRLLSGRIAGYTGEIAINQLLVTGDSFKYLGYVDQFDVHDEQSTVFEILHFSLGLRRPDLSREERLQLVETTMDLLELSNLRDAIVGTPSAGLSLADRKRLTIASQLVWGPAILLCDEPTTRMYASEAVRIVSFLKTISSLGIPVICTIHQPPMAAFNAFDNILLLEPEGRTAYIGPRADAFDFAGVSLVQDEEAGTVSVCSKEPSQVPISPSISAADFLLKTSENVGVLSSKWDTSPEKEALVERLRNGISPYELGDACIAPETFHDAGYRTALCAPYEVKPPSLSQQCYWTVKRASRDFFRDESFSYTQIFSAVAIGIVTAVSFWQSDATINGLTNRVFSVFIILFLPPVFSNVVLVKTTKLRNLWLEREWPSKMYSPLAFTASLFAAQLPYTIACSILYYGLWTLSLEWSSTTVLPILQFFPVVFLFFLFMTTLGMWISCISSSMSIVMTFVPFALLILEMFSGVLVPYPVLPGFAKVLYWISPFQWYLRAALPVLFGNAPVHCSVKELARLRVPDDVPSCAIYVESFLRSHGGYVFSDEASGWCSICPYDSGMNFLDKALGLDVSRTTISPLFVFFLTILFNVAMFYILVRRQAMLSVST